MTKKPPGDRHFMTRFTGKVALGKPITIRGKATSDACGVMTLHTTATKR
jgi:hypothetical protein